MSYGDKRIVRKFLWLPMTVTIWDEQWYFGCGRPKFKHETHWLKTRSWEEEFVRGHCTCGDFWKFIRWVGK